MRFIVISMEGESVGVDEVATQCSWAVIPSEADIHFDIMI